MSIKKTSIPSLAELSQIIGPSETENSKSNTRPLCTNIFDVQRGELMEEYERLRKAFWTDLVESTPLSGVQSDAMNPENLLQTASPLAREHTPLQSHLQPSAPTASIRTPSPLPQTQAPSRKRTLPDAQSVVSKRQKANSVRSDTIQTVVKLSPQKAYESLLQLKHLLLLQIKTAEGYNESKIISMLTEVKRTKSPEQSRHLAVYLVPVAKAMRRDTITKTLEQWFL